MTEVEVETQFNTRLRILLDSQVKAIRSQPQSDERDIATIKLREAVMWLGEDSRRRRV